MAIRAKRKWFDRRGPKRDGLDLGVEISSDAIRVATLSPAGHLLNDWVIPDERLQTTDVDTLCSVLVERLPQCVHLNRNRVCVSLPSSWLHFEVADANADFDALAQSVVDQSPFPGKAHQVHWSVDPEQTESAQVLAVTSRDAAFRVAETIRAQGYRMEAILPAGVAIGQAASQTLAAECPCVVSLDSDGGTVKIVCDGQIRLCRQLPPKPQPLHSGGPNHAGSPQNEAARWQRLVAGEIEATLGYYARMTGERHFKERITASSPILLAGRFADEQATVEDWLNQLAKDLSCPVAVWQIPTTATAENGQPVSTDLKKGAEISAAFSLAMLARRKSADRVTGHSNDSDGQTNLIPPAYYDALSRQQVWFGWTSAVAVALIVGSLLTIRSVNRVSSQQELARLAYDRVAPIRAQLVKLDTLTAEFNESIDHLNFLASQRPSDDALQCLAMTAAATAESAGRTQLHAATFDLQAGTLHCNGQVQQFSDFETLVETFEKHHWAYDGDSDRSPTRAAPIRTRRQAQKERSERSQAAVDDDGRFHWTGILNGHLLGKEDQR